MFEHKLENFHSKDEILLETLISFFSDKKYSDIMINILKKQTNISLRILDWLVTNYSKKHNIITEQVKNGNIINFNLYVQYKNQLRAYSKNNFDPFCRKNRIILDITDPVNLKKATDETPEENRLYTTVGQLNFFRWFIKNDLVSYLLLNIEEIEMDMNTVLQKNKMNLKQKRHCLSENNSNMMVIVNRPVKIIF